MRQSSNRAPRTDRRRGHTRSLADPPVALDDTSPRSSPDTASADSIKYPSRLFILEIFKTGHVAPPKFLDQWFDAKKKFAKRTGLSVAASYTVLRQDYSSSPIKQPISIGSKFAFLADYQLANRGKPNALSFDVVVEERQPLGTDLAPTPAGLGAGSIVPTATTWGRFDLGFTQYYFRQNLAGNRFQYVIGKLFAQYYIDAYPFFDDNRQFISRAFSTDATIPAPTRGFGLVGAWYPIVNHGFYVQSGMYTANSHDTGLTIDDFFKTGQHFYNLNLGWTRIEDRGCSPSSAGCVRHRRHLCVRVVQEQTACHPGSSRRRVQRQRESAQELPRLPARRLVRRVGRGRNHGGGVRMEASAIPGGSLRCRRWLGAPLRSHAAKSVHGGSVLQIDVLQNLAHAGRAANSVSGVESASGAVAGARPSGRV